MNKLIASHADEKLKNHYESWLRNPSFVRLAKNMPVAVRSGYKINGLITVFVGIEEGIIDLQVCLPREILEGMGNDPNFMDVVSN
ncbi:putative chloramphenicol acetyltransferase-like domain-containing protein [Medicago truncatula]|nr:putative chloramphenicol acetyltransferase-like domain-containing protein [Medicago truncatula]